MVPPKPNGNGNDDISSEKHLKISKNSGGSYFCLLLVIFVQIFEFLSRDPIPLWLLNKTLHQTLKPYLFLIYIVVDSHKSKDCKYTQTQRRSERSIGHVVFVLLNLWNGKFLEILLDSGVCRAGGYKEMSYIFADQ